MPIATYSSATATVKYYLRSAVRCVPRSRSGPSVVKVLMLEGASPLNPSLGSSDAARRARHARRCWRSRARREGGRSSTATLYGSGHLDPLRAHDAAPLPIAVASLAFGLLRAAGRRLRR